MKKENFPIHKEIVYMTTITLLKKMQPLVQLTNGFYGQII